jgi:hypothetical protein
MAVSILKDISTELYVAAIKLKFSEGNDLTSYTFALKLYEEDDLTSYTSGIFFPVTQGGEKACKYEID